MKHKNKMRSPDFWIEAMLIAILVVIAVIAVYPFLNVLALSFNESGDSIKGGITIWPRKFTLNNYAKVFQYPTLVRGAVISVLRTIIGSAASVLCTTVMAYTLSRQDFAARKFFNVLFMATMYVSGGLVPGYLLIRNLHLFNNFLVYILPGLVGAYYVFLMRSYIESLPFSLQESAMLDGANDIQIFYKIVLPLAKPCLATITLFYAVNQWNSWFDTYMYCSANQGLTTLQYELQKIIQSASAAASAAKSGSVAGMISAAQNGTITPQSIQMAITIVVIVPIIMVYPFLQKYFVSGMTVGAVKG